MKQVPSPVSIGATLRDARESQGRAISEIAAELCITPSYVRAIEDGNLKTLPGTFFYKSFAKQYAVLLGVDANSLGLNLLLQDEMGDAVSPNPHNGSGTSYRPPVRSLDPIVMDTNRRYFSDHPLSLSVAGLVAVLLACSGFYSWFTRVPSQPSPAAPSIVQPASVQTPVQSGTASSDRTESSSAPVQPGPDATASPISFESDIPGVVLDLSATESTWLSITSNGRKIFSGILRPSESKKLAVMDHATLKVGNAGGIEIRWNGKPIGPLGGRGEVRTVRLTPEEVQILSPAGQL